MRLRDFAIHVLQQCNPVSRTLDNHGADHGLQAHDPRALAFGVGDLYLLPERFKDQVLETLEFFWSARTGRIAGLETILHWRDNAIERRCSRVAF